MNEINIDNLPIFIDRGIVIVFFDQNLEKMKILIIGGGNMGKTYASSFLRSHITEKDDMMILERLVSKQSSLEAEDIGTIYTDPTKCLPKADLIILAVKPQDTKELFESLKPHINPQQVFLSIMAGVKIDSIRTALGIEKIVRAMPNMPAQIGKGMTAFNSTDQVTRIELVMVQNLLNTTGKTVYVENEALIDAATAISGSGPAYVYFFMNAIKEAAIQMGFKDREAELLTSQTFQGAVDLYNKADLSFESWIDKVASKGGTTEAAIDQFESSELHKMIKHGVQAALKRAIDLGLQAADNN